ncbi:peptidyl-tRNA hydrolase 2, mitochondrial-like [Liolophura sinensis]|uniref:peptidyl-tRNA hydrolase 2, mitochondrial-like n=1 Tax=Liolophura sinensis TaxID=3198878 RepID=UPI003157F3BC
MVKGSSSLKMEGHSTLLAAAVGLGCGLTLGWLLRGRLRIRSPSGAGGGSMEKSFAADSGEIKLVIVVRNDLKMGKGKAAAQCAHAAVAAVRNLSKTDPRLLSEWEDCGQPKVVVKTESEESLVELASLAVSKGLTASIIRDAGRTQIAPGSKTVLGVGPGPADLVDEVTGSLRLY